MKYTVKQLNDILAKHLKWLRNEVDGERANLSGADLSDANLSYADLSYAKNVDSVQWTIYSAFYPLQCPESGSFVGYKKASGYIVKLVICEDG